MKKILCLDFDGVICDSLKECLITSYISYGYYMNNQKNFHLDVKIPQNIKEKFYKYRYLVRPAKEYGMLQYLIHNYDSITRERFDESCKNYCFPMDEYESTFFEVRSKLISSNLSSWIGMNKIYPHVMNYWDSIISQTTTYIVTNKNLTSVRILLEHYNLEFNESNIFTKENIHSKAETLAFLADENCIKIENVIFIDDNSRYVTEMLDLGVQAYLASWGYEKMDIPNHLKKSNQIKNFGMLDKLIT